MSWHRPDKFPSIVLVNRSKAAPHVKRIKEDSGLEASVYDRAASYGLAIFPNHRVSHKTLERLLNANSKLALAVDHSILRQLTFMLRQSDARESLDKNKKPEMRNGKPLYELVVLGCRVKFKTQEELADRIGCSRQHLNSQLSILYELMIIVNKGKGWIDLNPNVFWYGKLDHQIAYCKQHCRLVWRGKDTPTLLCAWPLHTEPSIDGPVYMSWEDDDK